MSVPTLKAVMLAHHIKEDGSCNIKIRLTHNRKVKYIPTTEYARKGDYTKDLTLKNNALIKRLSTLIERIQGVISGLDYFVVQSMDVGKLYDYIVRTLSMQEPFLLDFFEWGEKVVATKPKYSGANYRTALHSFARFLGRETIDISEITSSMLRSFEAYLVEKHGKDARAVSMYTAALSTIHSEARKRYNNEELDEVLIKNPFEYYTPPKQKPTVKRCVEPETIQKLIDIRGSLSDLHKLAVDVFLLSFCLMGTNVPDLYEAKREKDVIYYNRTKTKARRHDNAEMRIRMEPVCKSIFDDMADPTGERAFMLHNQYTFYKSIADKANDRLKEVASIIGVQPFTMYAARHTWASFAYSIGIPKSLINDCLCHVDPNMAVTDIYIKKDWSVLWEANKKVLAKFKWK